MMIRKTYLILFLAVIVSQTIFSQTRETTTLQTGWKFAKGANPEAQSPDFNDSNWQDVAVPHDWAVGEPFIEDGNGSTGKLPWKGEGWYRTNLEISASDRGKTIYLVFDGVMAFPEVYVNGKLAGKWDYGYNSFYLNVTNLVKPGEANVLGVHADTRPHDSRWYPGGGIYRKVQMIKVNPVHVDVWGTYVTTPIIKPNYADVLAAATLNNHSDETKSITLKQTILSSAQEITSADHEVAIKAGKQRRVESKMTITDPRWWDTSDPHLYTLKTEVFENGIPVDAYTTPFGVRTIRFTADDGFYLNERRVQLKGVNLHHDHGPLGAAFYPRAMERQLEIMKSMGVNAIRTSHNTAAPELLDLCDEMGLLVFNEIFDKYDAKADILDTTDFDAFTHRNMRNFVKRDRNHPSVFLWSVGNEEHQVQWNNNNGFHRLRTMINYLEKYDVTRPNTLVCDSYKSAKLRHFDYYDVHSWNYDRRYWLARQLEPNKSVIISESASTVSTRGFYELPLPEEKTDFTESLQVSSYDLNAPYWAEIADDDFMWQQDEPYIAGEFVWTGFDYLGEPTPYDNRWTSEHGMTDKEASRSSYFGIVDLCGIPKDRYYLYKSYWKPEETTVHILPHWNWQGKEGENVPVFVYTNGDCAELFLNGKSLGMKCKNPKSGKSVERFRLMWNEVTYEPGELKVVAYEKGAKIGEATRKTTGKPYRLRLTPDQKTISKGGMDLSYVLIQALDKDGNVCPLADDRITISLDGNAQIAGVGNGNPQSFNPFQSNEVDLFYGKAMLILKSGDQAGKVKVGVSAADLKAANVSLEVR